MIFRYPKYYDEFQCIAGECEDTCCAGWEIDIDDESYRYYMSVEGEFGERLRSCIKEYDSEEEDVYESHGFILKEKKRCPFLNEKNLCDMYIELGESALCDVCTNTPRNILEYGGERELAISTSCPEAGRLIFGKEEKTTFVECEISEELDFEESEEEMAFAKEIRKARDNAIEILQNRGITIEERILLFLQYAEEVQQCLNENVIEEISNIDRSKWEKTSEYEKTFSENSYELFLKRMVSFTGMESINEEWEDFLKTIQEMFIQPEEGAKLYQETLQALRTEIRKEKREYEYEHLMVYYAFMCLARCVDDYDFIGKAKLCVASFLMIRDMDAVCFASTGGNFTWNDRVRVARVYAKEVEHSEENLEYLADEFLFEDAFSVENLKTAIF